MEKIKVVVFDLDHTLAIKGELVKDAVRVLSLCKSLDYKIALASYNTGADEIVDKTFIKEYFSLLVFGRDESKKTKFLKVIAEKLNVKFDEILFVDDQLSNIIAIHELGCQVMLADYIKGVEYDKFLRWLQSINTDLN